MLEPANTSSKKVTRAQTASVGDDLASFGLMTIDDLVGGANYSEAEPHSDESSIRTADDGSRPRSVADSIRTVGTESASSIHTLKDSIQTESIKSETFSGGERYDYDSDFNETLRDTESIASDTQTSGRQSYRYESLYT